MWDPLWHLLWIPPITQAPLLPVPHFFSFQFVYKFPLVALDEVATVWGSASPRGHTWVMNLCRNHCHHQYEGTIRWAETDEQSYLEGGPVEERWLEKQQKRKEGYERKETHGWRWRGGNVLWLKGMMAERRKYSKENRTELQRIQKGRPKVKTKMKDDDGKSFAHLTHLSKWLLLGENTINCINSRTFTVNLFICVC